VRDTHTHTHTHTHTQTTRLLLVRHGESTANAQGVFSGWSTDVVLTELGRRQASVTGAGLRRYARIDALYASPLPRTRQTAELIGAEIDLEPVLIDGLREIDVGEATGQPITELATLHPHLLRDVDDESMMIPWPGGESHFQLRTRAMAAIEDIVERHPGQTVVVVSHGGPLGWIVSTLASVPPRPYREFRHQNCAVSELLVPSNPFRLPAELIRFNDCAHL
jgi:broad specificity phosphatase PhoE